MAKGDLHISRGFVHSDLNLTESDVKVITNNRIESPFRSMRDSHSVSSFTPDKGMIEIGRTMSVLAPAIGWFVASIAKPSRPKLVWKLLGRTLLCLALVGVVTYAIFYVLQVNALVAGFAYLLVVLVIAARWGLIESSITSLAVMLCLNFFFLPPILTLTIADPQNWVALFVFMATSLTATQLDRKSTRRAIEAQARQAEVERLYELSRSLMIDRTSVV